MPARAPAAAGEDAQVKRPSGQFIVGITNSAPSLMPARAPAAEGEDAQVKRPSAQFIVGITNSAPSLIPDGQREVTVFVLV
jgi:hypothetical protein